jgi:hypothetical protein
MAAQTKAGGKITPATITPGDVRAEMARHRVKRYQISALIGYHPATLGAMLNERIPMPPEVGTRILEILRGSER